MLKCLICNKEFDNKHKFSAHVYHIHNLNKNEYDIKFDLVLKCKKCNAILKHISKKRKTDYCNHCRDRTGINNPFFNKNHSNETKQHLSETSSISSKSLWQNDEYRNKVISHITGLKRSDEFKEEQSKRIIKWYEENPEQQQIRSGYMKQSWIDGKIEPNINSYNESKKEAKELRAFLEKHFKNKKITKKVLRIENKWFYPDILINDKIIVEFYGDFWHANPNRYKSDDIVHHSVIAKEIWKRDKERVDILLKNGYTIFIIWQSIYDLNKEECVSKLIKEIDENQSLEKTI